MANPEHLALVRSGVEALNRFAREHEDIALDLEGADLHGLDLQEARLQGARLAGANLEGCDLRNARLNAADMRGCNLRNADLRETGMHRANLTDADLRSAHFATMGVGGQQMCISAASFQGVRWDREELERILALINLNPDWEIRYEIVPRSGQ
ncbi:MAG: hypothetical protein A2148_06490 [Chloroflexi bacterium RBG_16_68_14]|nr:MAG: hypothetical protein A2148_06490 [Chloroflexi bacterium RBG_16_68_14]